MLQHPAAVEGRAAYALIYENGDAPLGLAARLRKRGGHLMVSEDPRVREVGVFLHGLAEATEAHDAKGGR